MELIEPGGNRETSGINPQPILAPPSPEAILHCNAVLQYRIALNFTITVLHCIALQQAAGDPGRQFGLLMSSLSYALPYHTDRLHILSLVHIHILPLVHKHILLLVSNHILSLVHIVFCQWCTICQWCTLYHILMSSLHSALW